MAPTGCSAPQVELTRNGSTTCQTEAVCVSQGFDWKVTNGKCVQLPPCKSGFAYYDNSGTCRPLCESGYVYSSEFGICVTTGYGCPYPELDFRDDNGSNFCVTRTDCGPQSEGYFVLPPNCQYEPPTQVVCEDGYNPGFGAAEGGCYTPNFCLYPDLDFRDDGGNNSCVTRTQRGPQSEGYFVLPPNCQYEPPFSSG